MSRAGVIAIVVKPLLEVVDPNVILQANAQNARGLGKGGGRHAKDAVRVDDRRVQLDHVGQFLGQIRAELLVIGEALQRSALQNDFAVQASRTGADRVQKTAHHTEHDQHHSHAEHDARDAEQRDQLRIQITPGKKPLIHDCTRRIESPKPRNLQPSTFNLQPSTFNLQPLSLPPSAVFAGETELRRECWGYPSAPSPADRCRHPIRRPAAYRTPTP